MTTSVIATERTSLTRAGTARMLNNGTDTNIALIRINGHINNATWLRICASVKFNVQPIKWGMSLIKP